MHSEPPFGHELGPSHRPIEELERYRSGELTEAQYLDLRIEAGMAGVKGRISDGDYEMIRVLLAELLESDPVLVELKRRLLHR